MTVTDAADAKLALSMVERIGLPVLWLDQRGRVRRANQAAAHHLGRPLAELAALRVFDFDLTLDQSLWPATFAKAVDHAPYTLLSTHRRADGAEVEVEVDCVLLRHDKENLLACVVRDRAARAAQQEALRHSEEKLRSVLENASEGVFTTKISGEPLMVNTAMAQMMGYDSPEHALASVSNILDIYADPAQRTAILSMLARHGQVKSYELEMLRADGQKAWFSVSVRLQRDARGRPEALEGFAREITAQRQAQKELAIRGQAMDKSPLALFLADLEGRVTYANQSLAQMWALAGPDRATGLDAVELWADRDQAGRIMRNLAHEDHWQGELKARRPDGGTFWTLATISVIHDDNDRPLCIMAAIQDITAAREAELARRTSEQNSQAVLDSIGETALVIDTNGVVLSHNKVAGHRLGPNNTPIMGRCIYDFLEDAAAAARMARVEQVVTTGKPVRFEDHLGGVWYDNFLQPIFDDSGRVARLAVLSIDITRRRLTEEVLAAKSEELQKQSRRLEEMNTALKVLLEQREDDKHALEERIWYNVQRLVLPALHKLMETRLDQRQRAYAETLDHRLTDLTSGLGSELAHVQQKLTPRELEVAGLVVEGKSTKEIADILALSPKSVEAYRFSIRRKLGLKGRQNLRTYLLSATTA